MIETYVTLQILHQIRIGFLKEILSFLLWDGTLNLMQFSKSYVSFNIFFFDNQSKKFCQTLLGSFRAFLK